MKRKVNRKISKDKVNRHDRRVPRWFGRLAVLSVVLAGTVFGVIRISDPSTLPIRAVQVEGAFKYLDVARLQEAVSKYAGSGFFDLDISNIQETVKSMSWVDQVSVRRIWPDTVRIRVKEHVPLARWEENGLVNIRGEWFDAKQDASVKMLPEFSGPEGFSKKLTDKYYEIKMVLKPAGLDIAKLKMDQRRTWKVALKNGIDLDLGKSGVGVRLNRFVRVYPLLLAQLSAGLSLKSDSSLESSGSKIERIDLRYTNGFSIRWQRQMSNSGLQSPNLQSYGLQGHGLQSYGLKNIDLMNRGIEKNV